MHVGENLLNISTSKQGAIELIKTNFSFSFNRVIIDQKNRIVSYDESSADSTITISPATILTSLITTPTCNFFNR